MGGKPWRRQFRLKPNGGAKYLQMKSMNLVILTTIRINGHYVEIRTTMCPIPGLAD